MTTSPSLLGSVERSNLVLGAARCFVAPYSTYIDEYVKFSTNSPPVPWLDLGPSQPGASLSLTQEFYKYLIGVPRVMKDKKKTSIDFQLGVTLDHFSGANLARAIYNTNYAIKVYFSSPAIVQAAAIPAGEVVQMTSTTGYVEGQYVGLASSSIGLANTVDEYKIVEISGVYLILDRVVATTFSAAPYVGMIKSWKVPYGTSKSCQIAFLMVFDGVDGDQMVVAIPNASLDGNFNSGISASSNSVIQMNVSGQAFFDVDVLDNSIANILRFSA